MEVKYYRTDVDGRKPTANNMEYGEIAVNYNSTNPRLMIKDSNNAIASFLPESYINEEFKQIDGDLNEIGKNVSANTASIDALEAWVNEPLTDDEINGLFTPPLITFSVSGTEYQAEEGMTWEEWVDSEYNEIGASIYRLSDGTGHIAVGNQQQGVPVRLHYSNGDYVNITQEIITNHNYTAISGGGGI